MNSPWMQEELWPFRTKPKDDEIFSSLLVRMAYGLGVKLQSFTKSYLNLHAGFWTGDVDRNPNLKALQILSVKAHIPFEKLSSTGIVSYTGSLWEDFHNGPLAWITTVGRDGRKRYRYGQQYCRLCLEEDEVAYFRKNWRLAFNTVCINHKVYLRDECSFCKSPVIFHGGDFGKKLLPLDCPITFCMNCGNDFRFVGLSEDIAAPTDLISFQNKLNSVLLNGVYKNIYNTNLYGHLFFTGFRRLIQYCCSNSRSGRIRKELLKELCLLDFGFCSYGSYQFESMRVGDRALVLFLASQLLRDWPYKFIDLCKHEKVSSSYLIDYRKSMPYWLWREVNWYLNDKDYAPSDEEFKSVEAHLIKNNIPINMSNINLLLGVSAVSVASQTKKVVRWNPRGKQNGYSFNCE